MKSVHAITSCLLKFHRPSSGLSSGLFPSGCLTETVYKFLLSPMRITGSTQLFFLELITLIIFGEYYKLWSSSLLNFHQFSLIFFLLGQYIVLRTLFSNFLSVCSSLMAREGQECMELYLHSLITASGRGTQLKKHTDNFTLWRETKPTGKNVWSSTCRQN